MSYEVESIVSPSASQPMAPSQPQMREERVIDPYHVRAPKPVIGQPDKGKESPAPAEPGKPEETAKLSNQAALLAKQEQKFRAQHQALEKEKATLAAEKAEVAELRALKEKLAKKDYSGLEGMVDYNDYSQYQVDKLNNTDPTQQELKKLNEKIAGIEKSAQENLEKQFEAAVQERRNAAKELVDQGSEYPRIKKAQAHEAVVQHILDTWEHDSVELSVSQAAKEVEEALLEKAKQWASLLEDQKEAIKQESKKPLPPLKQGLKTLTNQVTAGDFKRPQKSFSDMNDSERYQEARRRALEKLELRNR